MRNAYLVKFMYILLRLFKPVEEGIFYYFIQRNIYFINMDHF